MVEIDLPPLRERRNDIPFLAQSFLREFASENEKKVNGIAPEAMDALRNFNWPGNVRELRTSVEHAVVLCRGDKIMLRDLPPSVREFDEATGAAGGRPLLVPGDLTVKEAEKQMIVHALKECHGSRTAAARRLGMSRRTLHRKLHGYHLEGF